MAKDNMIRMAGRELLALGRQAWLLPREISRLRLPDHLEAQPDVVVCMHGLFATAGVLRPLRNAIEAHAATAALSYPVGPGVEALAERLEDLLTQLPSDARIHLVGHSVGGVVTRHYATTRDDPRLVQTVSLAAPFAGLRGAGIFGVAIARDLAPSSPILHRLRMTSLHEGGLPHLSIMARNDQVLRPSVTHALAGGAVHTIAHCGHNGLLFDKRAVSRVCQQVAQRCRETAVSKP
jgi:predicted alpha/beta hydrolase family esterase